MDKKPKQVKREQITFRLPETLREYLDERASAERRTIGEYLRMVIEDDQRNTSNQTSTT